MSGIDRDDVTTHVAHEGDYEGTELVATAHARNYNRWILDAMRPHVRGVIAEVGAGRGNFTRELLELAPERLYAIEPSGHLFPRLVEATAAEARVVARRGTLEDVAAELEGRLDAVVYVNVLEHIDDDHAELPVALRVLRPGGTLAVFVPALPWLASRFDASIGHHRRYDRAGLIGLATAAGFDVVSARWFDLLGIATWLVAFKMLRMEMTAGPVGMYDRVAVPVARALDRVAGPPVGKSLLLIARRP